MDEVVEPFYCYICEKKRPYFRDFESGDMRPNCYFFRIGGFEWIACHECFETLQKLRGKIK